jgi:hypothetical protein
VSLLELPDAEPQLFAGPADAVQGRLQLVNDTDARLSLRGGVVEVDGLPSTEVSFVAVLPPGARTRATAMLRLDPATAVGTYLGEVEVGGQRWAAQVVVLPSTTLSLLPEQVMVSPPTTTVTVVVRNDGTVAVDLPATVRADLDEGPVTGRLDAAVRVEPARSAVLALTIELPPKLDATRRYAVKLPLGPAELEVVVPPRTPIARPTPTTRPKAARRTT